MICIIKCFLVSAASTTATNYSNAYMEHCNCANFKVAGLRKAKRIVRHTIHTTADVIDHKQVQQLQMEHCNCANKQASF